MKSQTRSGRGFSITEVLVVIGVIVVLLGLLFPALAGIRKSGLMAKSMGNMRQIGTWMGLYSQDNRDYIVPSQFNYDYAGDGYKGKVRSVITQNVGRPHQGTWADILWTVYEIGVFPLAIDEGPGHDYRYDSPDGTLYGTPVAGGVGHANLAEDFDNPLRSAAPNSRNTHRSWHELPTPYGCGASEIGLPGYFAANNFFAGPNTERTCPAEPIQGQWYTNGQIRMPERSMYLVDSFAGETIEPLPEPFQISLPGSGPGDAGTWARLQSQDRAPGQVDFRYSNMCLMMFLDGHVEPQGKWKEICDLEGPGGRGIRIRALTARSPDVCP
jgi:type II secretory pathway pseudopilin PulG